MSEIEISFEVDSEGEQRLDKCIFQTLQPTAHAISRSKIASCIKQGAAKVDEEVVLKPSYLTQGGEQITFLLPFSDSPGLLANPEVRFGVLYEDDDLLVVDKPPNLVVHPGSATEQDTLVHGLLSYLGPSISHVGHPMRPGIVHRLDKDTSGAMLIAKNQKTYLKLTSQFLPPRLVKRSYLAVVARLPSDKASGTIDAPIGRDPNHRTKMAVVGGGRPAVTHWKLLRSFDFGALLALRLETGRTHQIRVHLKHIGAPIVGDETYYSIDRELPEAIRAEIKRLGRQALHAAEIEFLHPSKNEIMIISSPLPSDLERLLEAMGSG